MKEVEVPEYLALIIDRENLYRFLGRLFKGEVDQPLLKHIAGMYFPTKSPDEGLAEGYRLMEGYLRSRGQDTLTDLATDYKKIFTASDSSANSAVCPYESVYTSPERKMNRAAREQVKDIYDAKGLVNANASILPEDHIGLELEYMALLCLEAQQYFKAKDRVSLAECLIEQKDFLAKHVLNWAPAFCADVEKFAATDFYKAVAKIADGFLRVEQGIVHDLVEETIVEETVMDTAGLDSDLRH